MNAVPRAAYCLTLAPELRAYAPEIDYVCALLDEAHGLARSDEATVHLHYGAAPPPGAIAIPAAFFTRAATIDPDGLHLDRTALDAIAQFLLPREDARQFDAIALVFLLVSRLEERAGATGDRYGRYAAAADFQHIHGLYGGAPADDALAALARLITGERNPASATTYRVMATHDVDRLKAYHAPLEPLRYAAGDILKRGRIAQGLRRLSAYVSDEPWGTFNDIMDLSERFGLRSHFFFMGPSRDTHDSPYAETMIELLKRVAGRVGERGHAIGFHAGYGTADDAELWRRRRTGLETVLGLTVREGRQHMLAYRVDRTPDIWDSEGMDADYTLSYPEIDGFRTGSSRIFPAYSIVNRRRLRLRQGSTAVMDFGMFDGKYRDLTVEEALDRCRPIIGAARRHGGTLIVLFHSGQPHGRPRRFYEDLLRETA